jgi:hypothetical protein
MQIWWTTGLPAALHTGAFASRRPSRTLVSLERGEDHLSLLNSRSPDSHSRDASFTAPWEKVPNASGTITRRSANAATDDLEIVIAQLEYRRCTTDDTTSISFAR